MSTLLLQLFITQIPQTLGEIETAFQKRQGTLLRAHLHKLLGACKYCYLAELEDVVKACQVESQAGRFSMNHLARLRQELYRVAKTGRIEG